MWVFTEVEEQQTSSEANNVGPQANIVGLMSAIILVSALMIHAADLQLMSRAEIQS